MKVGIYETVEVSDEQRKAISKEIGVAHATRDQLKQYIWDKGAFWFVGLIDETDEADDQMSIEDLL